MALLPVYMKAAILAAQIITLDQMAILTVCRREASSVSGRLGVTTWTGAGQAGSRATDLGCGRRDREDRGRRRWGAKAGGWDGRAARAEEVEEVAGVKGEFMVSRELSLEGGTKARLPMGRKEGKSA